MVDAISIQAFASSEMTDEALVTSLMQVMSEVDQGLVNNIRNGKSNENDEDRLHDFLVEYYLVAIPTIETVEGVLLQVAKRVLIQEPYFVIDCWRTLAADWDIEIDIRNIYTEAEPTAEKLLLKSAVW